MLEVSGVMKNAGDVDNPYNVGIVWEGENGGHPTHTVEKCDGVRGGLVLRVLFDISFFWQLQQY